MRHPSSFAATLVLGFTLGPSTSAAPGLAPAQPANEVRVIEVTAKRFSFEPSTIEVRVGERVRLVLRTADGLHGIELKRFKIAKEIPRGTKPIIVEFTADEVGRFPFLCSEYCGDNHDDMKGTLVVLARDAAPAQPPQPDSPAPAPAPEK